MKILIFLLVVLHIFQPSASVNCDGEPRNTEARLKRKMLCEYDKSVRPLIDSRNATIVRVKMVVKDYKYNENEDTLTVNSWMVMSWKDDHLKWDPREYDNINSFYENSDTIWNPNLALYNADIGGSSNACQQTDCVIYSTGTVMCIPPCSYVGRCEGDYIRWPFDQQNCTLMFGTWINTGEEINFDGARTSIGSDDAIMNKKWKLISTSVKKHAGNYSCCPNQTFPSLKFNFIVERHSTKHAVIILIPAIIMLVINMITLLLDANSTERLIILGLNAFMHFEYLQQLSWYVPSNGDNVPCVIIFFRDSLFITAILLANTAVIRKLMTMERDVPNWIYTPTEYISTNIIGRIMIQSPKAEKIGDSEAAGDEDILVGRKDGTGWTKQNSIWRKVANIIDVLLFVIVALTYFILIIGFIPEGYADNSKLNKIEVEGKSSS